MAKKATKQNRQSKWLEIWWFRLLLGVVFLTISYGFIAWAIDTGSLWQYALGIILAYWGVAHIIRGVLHGFSR